MRNEYSLLTGIPDAPYADDLDVPVFFDPQHLALQSDLPHHSYYVQHVESNVVLAVVHFVIENNIARSPARSPFGSFLSSEKIPLLILVDFLRYVEQQLHSKGVREIVLANPPERLFPRQMSILQPILFQAGYSVQAAEISSVVPIKSTSFIQPLDDWERRKFFMCQKAGFIAKQISVERLEQCYRFIERCRARQSRSLSLSFEELRKLAAAFPDRFILYGVYVNEEIVAASINIQVTKSLLYNFYGAHDSRYNKMSPVVMMYNEIYKHCQQAGIRLLDLGTSTRDGLVNFSLLDFKTRLGAEPTSKLAFIKKIDA